MRSTLPARQQANHQRNKTLRRGYVQTHQQCVRWTTEMLREQHPEVKVIVSENALLGRVISVTSDGTMILYSLPFGPDNQEHRRIVSTHRVLDHLNGAGPLRLYPTADTADKRRRKVVV